MIRCCIHLCGELEKANILVTNSAQSASRGTPENAGTKPCLMLTGR